MKALFKSVALLSLLSLCLAPAVVRAQDDAPPPGAAPSDDSSDDSGASFQNFYDQLGSQGNWVQTDDYGYVFQPNVSDPNWAPYTDGHWVYTDDGWAWVSDEPWGWATYHYGRWANIDGTGWVWVPGYRWAPAWVSWRYGGGYCGWAPLPPGSFIGAEYGGGGGGVGFHFGGDVDVNFGIGAGCYNFLSVGDLGESNYRGRFVNRYNNYTIINRTTNITNINVNNNYGGSGAAFRGVASNGPPINEVNAHSRTPVPTVQLTESNRPGESHLQGNSLSVYAPRVNPASAKTARPARVSQTIAHPTFNRGTSISKPLAVNSRLRPSAPSTAQVQAARTAMSHVPASAHIATAKTPVKTAITRPLSAMTPVDQVRKTANTAKAPATERARSSAEASEKPAETRQMEKETRTPAESKPATTYRPEEETRTPAESKPATTYRPEEETRTPAESKPATTYHPEGETRTPAETKPATTYHPENVEKPRTEEKPATHEVSHNEGAPKQENRSGGNKPGADKSGGDKNKNQPGQ